MIIKLDNKSGVKLKTYKKYCNEDIEIMPMLREKQVLKNGEYIPPSGYIEYSPELYQTQYKGLDT